MKSFQNWILLIFAGVFLGVLLFASIRQAHAGCGSPMMVISRVQIFSSDGTWVEDTAVSPSWPVDALVDSGSFLGTSEQQLFYYK